MNQSFLDDQRAKLEAERDMVEEELASMSALDTGDHVPGERAPAFPDYGNDSLMENSASPGEVADFGLNVDITSRLQQRIHDIDAAIERLTEGTYGVCSNCKDAIPVERLEANPSADQCIDCATAA